MSVVAGPDEGRGVGRVMGCRFPEARAGLSERYLRAIGTQTLKVNCSFFIYLIRVA